MPKMVDLTGQTFGRLKVLSKHPERSNNGSVQWLVKCECGTSEPFLIIGATMKSGNTTSCGCLRREKTAEKFRKHGLHGKPEYWIWVDMRRRCYTKTFKQYKDYGGRGIRLSDEWNESFENFYKDMGPRPSEEHSIDRINNDGNYEKGNCRWTTKDVQANNMSTNKVYELDGEKYTVSQLSTKFKMHPATMRTRLLWLPIEAAVDSNVKFSDYKYTIRGVTKTMKEWLRSVGIDNLIYFARRERGWSINDALSAIHHQNVKIDGVTETIDFWMDLFGIENKVAPLTEILNGAEPIEVLKKYTK